MLVALIGSACVETSTPSAQPSGSAETPQTTTHEVISDSIESFIGETVSVQGEVRERIDDASFLLEDERPFFGGEDIIVISVGEPITLLNGDESDLYVTGEVRQLAIADFAREYGLQLNPDLYAEYENLPVIIAQSIIPLLSPGELTRDPERYYNQQVMVSGEVDDRVSSTVFTLDEEQVFGGEDLLVIRQQTTIAIAEDEDVVVTGVLRPYVEAEFERDYDLNWDLSTQETLEAEYREKPVFVADDIQRSDLSGGY
ncbi:hypothetical protein [Vacuolonema iberomarrocanum]|uniref:hypothetical protein n=1 Tax=Vacuolonema iberomarrocanum TaxID=3454632 RepID=UPI0019D87BCE|nr:hypothetical protein [filamentous cyanobacterium LEGE 07170]